MSPTTKVAPEPGARERLLQAALALFNEKGYAATSVRELVETAGVTKPVLYYYFGNKEGIYLELMRGSWGTFETLVTQGIELNGSPTERIIQFCSALFDVTQRRLPEVRLIYAIYYGPPQGAPQFDIDAYFLRMMEVVHGLVVEGIAAGELRQGCQEDAARAVIGMFTSAVNELLSLREKKLDRDGLERLLRLLMNGMSAGGNA